MMDEEEVQERASPFARLEYEEWKRHQTPHLEAKENTSQWLFFIVLGSLMGLLAIYLLLFL
uniref:Uncharacterized protein n=1 Tax=Thermofilum adornatum TaxID=1365176 RepID=A0A7C1CBY5_9CREN